MSFSIMILFDTPLYNFMIHELLTHILACIHLSLFQRTFRSETGVRTVLMKFNGSFDILHIHTMPQCFERKTINLSKWADLNICI